MEVSNRKERDGVREWINKKINGKCDDYEGEWITSERELNNTSEEKYSFILIQLKNYSISGQAYTEAATTRLSPSSVFGESELANLDLPYLCFYWSLGATESNSRLQFKSWKDFEQHWGVFSLDPFRFLTEDLKTKLYALLCAYINPFDSISIWKRRPTISIEQHRANVKCFFPVEKI